MIFDVLRADAGPLERLIISECVLLATVTEACEHQKENEKEGPQNYEDQVLECV